VNCPTKETTWLKCSNRGHWVTVCKSSKTVGAVEEENYTFLGAVGTSAGENSWSAKPSLNSFPVSFKIGIAADVVIIPESIYNSLHPSPSQERLCLPSRYSPPYPWLLYGEIHSR